MNLLGWGCGLSRRGDGGLWGRRAGDGPENRSLGIIKSEIIGGAGPRPPVPAQEPAAGRFLHPSHSSQHSELVAATPLPRPNGWEGGRGGGGRPPRLSVGLTGALGGLLVPARLGARRPGLAHFWIRAKGNLPRVAERFVSCYDRLPNQRRPLEIENFGGRAGAQLVFTEEKKSSRAVSS